MTYSDHERDPDTPMVTVAVSVRPGPRRTRAEISGEIDADNCGKVRDALNAALDASTAGLDIGLSALTFCDCSGLHLLLDLHLTAATTGKTLVLHAPRPQFTRLLDLTDTAPLLTIHTPPAHQPHPHNGHYPVTGGDATGPTHHRPHAIEPAIAYDDEP
ncbi:STAS domain-containing protein [Streptomyces sp. M-16]|uniref:STAS domain-containing protein n=1 Tax=Streptomyces sp. M-16 TaxID=3233040 RepID=UPI00225B202A